MAVTKNAKKQKDRAAESPARDRYHPPEIQEFGPVGALTCAGTGVNAERGAMAMMLDWQRP